MTEDKEMALKRIAAYEEKAKECRAAARTASTNMRLLDCELHEREAERYDRMAAKLLVQLGEEDGSIQEQEYHQLPEVTFEQIWAIQDAMKHVDGLVTGVFMGEKGVIRHERGQTPLLWASDSKGKEGVLVVGIAAAASEVEG